ncbi:hypothetical protein FJZ26_05645, partial [Candidatus Parvarchaeota archaeon]|nr:hypothetical protein [Candidatus Parvarchaeota archaeon]
IYSYKDAKVVPTSLAATHTDAAVRACGRRVWCTVPSPGKFQLPNIACAVLAFVGIKGFFDGKAIAAGLEKTAMRGRLETVGTGPLVVMDCAHNPQAFVALSQTLGIFKKNRIVLVFGAMKDKDSHGMLKIIRKKIKHVVLTSPYVRGRALNARQLVPLVKKLGIGFDVVDRPQSAVSRAKKIAGRDGMVLVAGSMYMLSQARHWKISRNHY